MDRLSLYHTFEEPPESPPGVAAGRTHRCEADRAAGMIRRILSIFRRPVPIRSNCYAPLNEPMDFWPDDICAPDNTELPEHWADDRP